MDYPSTCTVVFLSKPILTDLTKLVKGYKTLKEGAVENMLAGKKYIALRFLGLFLAEMFSENLVNVFGFFQNVYIIHFR